MRNATFEKYDNYQKSNVEWVEELPTVFGVKRLKEVLRDVVYGTSEKTEEVGDYEVIGMGDINDGKITFPKKRFIDNVPKDLLLKKDDLLFNRTNSIALVGKVGWVEEDREDVTFASYLIRLKVMKDQCSKYWLYLLNSEYFINYSRSNAIQTANQANLSSSKLKQFKIIAIDNILQKVIVDYLDDKTKRIDRRIELLTQKANLYGNIKQSLINETVTYGLDKSVVMKDSGVEWIGVVPHSWHTKRVKDLFEESKKKSVTGEERLLSVSEYNGVTLKKDNIEEEQFLTRAETLVGYKICKVGELVINIMLAWKRGLGISPFDGIVSPSYAVYTPSKSVYSAYFHYLFRSERAIAEFKRNSTGIIESRLRLYTDSFFALEVAIPDYKEQKAIADYLDQKTAHIDHTVETINTQIDKLKELRKTLINDVVTGKIKVTVEGGATG